MINTKSLYIITVGEFFFNHKWLKLYLLHHVIHVVMFMIKQWYTNVLYDIRNIKCRSFDQPGESFLSLRLLHISSSNIK